MLFFFCFIEIEIGCDRSSLHASSHTVFFKMASALIERASIYHFGQNECDNSDKRAASQHHTYAQVIPRIVPDCCSFIRVKREYSKVLTARPLKFSASTFCLIVSCQWICRKYHGDDSARLYVRLNSVSKPPQTAWKKPWDGAMPFMVDKKLKMY